MAACINAPIVAIQTVGRAGVGKGCSGSRRTPVVQQDRGFVSLPRHGGVGSSDVADGRQHPTHNGRNNVNQAHLDLVLHGLGKVIPPCVSNELSC